MCAAVAGIVYAGWAPEKERLKGMLLLLEHRDSHPQEIWKEETVELGTEKRGERSMGHVVREVSRLEASPRLVDSRTGRRAPCGWRRSPQVTTQEVASNARVRRHAARP